MTQSRVYNYKSVSLVILKIDLAQVTQVKAMYGITLLILSYTSIVFVISKQEVSRMSFEEALFDVSI